MTAETPCRHWWISHGGWHRCRDCQEPLPRVGIGPYAIAAIRAMLKAKP